MNLILDTHIFLWFIAGDERLSLADRALIEEGAHVRLLSVASLWEIAIKASMGKLSIPSPISELVRDHVWANAIQVLPIEPRHLDRLHGLPFHHRDPFDRLIIAQALSEDLDVLTEDSCWPPYGVRLR